MTQPSLNSTFDTSLIDLQAGHSSFSTTNSDPSLYNQPSTDETTLNSEAVSEQPAPAATSPTPSTAKKIQYLPTTEAYDAWASVYDTDGNMLQALDDIEMTRILPALCKHVLPDGNKKQMIRIVDLGCGTARNTTKLLSYTWPSDIHLNISGIDASAGMLDVARSKMAAALDKLPDPQKSHFTVSFLQYDLLGSEPLSAIKEFEPADAVISTLVLEHIPLGVFFAALKSAVVPGGFAVVTNMHPDMGAISQAGFVQIDQATGEKVKVRPTSYAHGVQQTIDAAVAHGFELVEDVEERGVDDESLDKLGARAKKWLGIKVWYGMILKRV